MKLTHPQPTNKIYLYYLIRKGLHMKKLMLVGPIGCGKTTLTQRLTGVDLTYVKTQALEFHDSIIDTPGEFVQHRLMYNALLVTSSDADIIGFLLPATEKEQIYSPGFTSLFNKPVIGIITKIDLLAHEDDYIYAEEQLRMAGAHKIFRISAVENIGIDKLQTYLDELP